MEPKVLLVYPPNQLMPSELPRPDGSLGPLYLAGALERAGVEVDVLDANVGTKMDDLDKTFNRQVMQDNGLIRIGMTTECVSEVIARGGYNIVGVHSNFTPQTKMALEVVQAAKRVSKDILVVAGGVNARALPERFLAGGVDAVCNTEGEEVIVNLVRAWQHRMDLVGVTGAIVRHRGSAMRHPPVPSDTLTDLDGLPFPAWGKLPFEHYDRIASAGRDSLAQGERSASIMTSRGCPFICAYCHISNEKEYAEESGGIGNLRLKSVDRVMAEVEVLKSLGVGKIYLEDDSLLAKKGRVREIFSRIKGQGLKIADVNGVNLVHFLKGGRGGRPTIDVDFLRLLYEAGLTQIVFPVESASQRILDKYATKKLNHDNLDVVELVSIASKIGITCPVNMMIGFPDETEAEINESIDLGRRLVDAGAPYVSLYIPIPFPGSRLHEMALKGGYLEPGFNTDAFNWRKPTMRNTTVSPERIEEFQREGWMSINPPEYVRKRLEMDIGKRWKSGEPESK